LIHLCLFSMYFRVVFEFFFVHCHVCVDDESECPKFIIFFTIIK